MVTPADRLREKANGLRSPVRYMASVGEVIVAPTAADEREAVLLNLLADAWEALNWAHDFVPAGIRPIGPAAKTLARIEEIA